MKLPAFLTRRAAAREARHAAILEALEAQGALPCIAIARTTGHKTADIYVDLLRLHNADRVVIDHGPPATYRITEHGRQALR